jgi:hypothetical protein
MELYPQFEPLDEVEAALEGDEVFFHNGDSDKSKPGGVIKLVEEATAAYQAEQAELEKQERARRLAKSLSNGKAVTPFSRTMGEAK